MLPEVRAALTRGYGAASRQTAGQRSLTLSSAVPIRADGEVLGAVVVSQSTFRILQALYDVRLRLFEIVLLSLGAAAVLTLVASSTIVNPLLRLQQAAAGLTGRSGALGGVFIQVKRKDEIGDLARSLEHLAARLDDHIKLLESFAADVAHEFRNPLTAIRTAAETVADTDSADERQRFLGMLLKDVDRLEKLVSGVRELASIDTQLSTAERARINLSDLLRNLVAGRGQIVPTPLKLQLPAAPVFVLGSADRLWQVFENLVDNAASFSPPGTDVEISAVVQSGSCVVTVADRGPGIPDEHLARVFERFFSYRPGSDRREHMGLGLAIAQAVVAGLWRRRGRPQPAGRRRRIRGPSAPRRCARLRARGQEGARPLKGPDPICPKSLIRLGLHGQQRQRCGRDCGVLETDAGEVGDRNLAVGRSPRPHPAHHPSEFLDVRWTHHACVERVLQLTEGRALAVAIDNTRSARPRQSGSSSRFPGESAPTAVTWTPSRSHSARTNGSLDGVAVINTSADAQTASMLSAATTS